MWSRNSDLTHYSTRKILGRYVMFHTLDLLDLLNWERHPNTLFLSILQVCGKILEERGTKHVSSNKTIWISQPLPIACSNSASSVIKKCTSMVPKQSKHRWSKKKKVTNELCMTYWYTLRGAAWKNPVWSKKLESTDVWLWNPGQGFLNLKLLPLQGNYLWFMSENKWRVEIAFSQMVDRCHHLLALEISEDT